MAWTTPRTWVANELVTAAQMNAHVRDNLNAIGQPSWAYAKWSIAMINDTSFRSYNATGTVASAQKGGYTISGTGCTITVPETATYLLTAVAWNPNNTSGVGAIVIDASGFQTGTRTTIPAGTDALNPIPVLSCSTVSPLTASQVVTLTGFCNCGISRWDLSIVRLMVG